MIRIGMIGTGGISRVHLGILSGKDDVEIAALCDINPEHLEARRTEFGGTGYADFNEMLEKEDLDAVWICTPPQVREEPLAACAERKVPVFCEKPVERDEIKAGRIAYRLENMNARIQIGYVFRAMPVISELKRAMADDRIHAVQSFYGCGVSLSRTLPSWFYDKELSGGALVDQGTHNFDLLRYLFGEVEQIRGLSSNPVSAKEPGYTIDEVLSLSLRFESGMLCSHTHTWVGDKWFNEILLSGEKRQYRLVLWKGTLETIDDSDVKTFRQEGSIYLGEDNVFLEMVRSGDWSRNPCTYGEGLKSLQLTTACERALN